MADRLCVHGECGVGLAGSVCVGLTKVLVEQTGGELGEQLIGVACVNASGGESEGVEGDGDGGDSVEVVAAEAAGKRGVTFVQHREQGCSDSAIDNGLKGAVHLSRRLARDGGARALHDDSQRAFRVCVVTVREAVVVAHAAMH